MKQALFALTDLVLAPLCYLCGWPMKGVRRLGMHRFPVTRKALEAAGVFPVRDHYYEPLFRKQALADACRAERSLPGVDFNVEGQLELLSRFTYQDELRAFPRGRTESGFTFDNTFFGPGDAEFLYNMVRHFRPRRIVEIGSGHSTRIASEAVKRNVEQDAAATCKITCVEPYENQWLEELDVEVVRQEVQTLDKSLFEGLEANDILFIDSSHMIRPGGDVLCEFLELVPLVRPGVHVHVHDIFSPREYPERWIVEEVRFWNEQYLLEAFLSFNAAFEVVGALNFLAKEHTQALAAACPVFGETPGADPGSFWMTRVAT